MITYYKSVNGKRSGSFRTLVELSECQIKNVENELRCKILKPESQGQNAFEYRVCVDGFYIKKHRTAKLMSDCEKDRYMYDLSKKLDCSLNGMTMEFVQ